MLRNLLPVILFLLSINFVTAQTFESTTGDIQDTGCEAFEFDLSEANIPNEEDGTGTATLTQVCLDITHPNVEDLLIYLTSPNNKTIELSLGNGGDGDDYNGTCFTATATTNISTGAAPFIGDFLPQQDLDILNDGLSPNSVWAIRICDINPDSEGAVNSAQLVFASVLPVTLSQFSAKENNNRNEIQWSTATEINVESHTVLKSVNTQNWITVATVEGESNSSSNKSYSVIDARPYDLTYYKLMTTDLDGTKSYSGVVSVNRSGRNFSAISASPVPTQSMVNVTISTSIEQTATLTVVDMTGRTVLQSTRNIEEGNNQLPIDLSEVSSGVYFVSLRSNFMNESIRVIKK